MTYTPIPRGTQNWDVPLNAALATLDASISSSSGTALQKANNLSDLTNVAQARTNLNLTGLANALANMTATTNPSVTSDNTQGYSIGSTWFNTTTNGMYVATNVSTGAAVWLQIPPSFVDLTTTQFIAGNKTFTSLTAFSNNSTTTPITTMTSTANGGKAQLLVGNQAADTAQGVRVTGDTNDRFSVGADGKNTWGPGNAPGDVNLYRVNSTTLKSDNNIQAANFTPAAWVTYTPVWTSGGTAPAIGNGTLAGRYSITGKTVNVIINMIAGSTTTFGTGSYTFSLPFQAANQVVSEVGLAHLLDTTRWAGHIIVSPNANNAGPFFPASSTDTRLTGVTSTVPQTLTTAAQIRLTFAYEMA